MKFSQILISFDAEYRDVFTGLFWLFFKDYESDGYK